MSQKKSYLHVVQDALVKIQENKTYTSPEINALYWKFLQYPENYVEEDSFEKILHCYYKYIDIILKYAETDNFQSHKVYRSNILKYMLVLRNITSIPNIANEFVKKLSQPLLEHVTDPSIKMNCAKELIKAYTDISKHCDKSEREKIVQSGCRIYLYKLADIVCTCGDYEYQAILLEAIFRICSGSFIREYASEFFPEAQSIHEAFVKINTKAFDNALRIFLNNVNRVYGNVYSLVAMHISFDDVDICPPVDTNGNKQELWIDFNKCSKTISIYCDQDCLRSGSNSNDSEDFGWELITIFLDDISTVEIKKPKTQLTEKDTPVLFRFTLIHPFYVLFSSSEHITTSKYLQVLTFDNNIIGQLQNDILPEMFKEKFLGYREKKKAKLQESFLTDSSKGNYKPLPFYSGRNKKSITGISADSRSLKSIEDVLMGKTSEKSVSSKNIDSKITSLNSSINSIDSIKNDIPETQYFSTEENLEYEFPPKKIDEKPCVDNQNTTKKRTNSKERIKMELPLTIRKAVIAKKHSFDPLFSPINESNELSRSHYSCADDNEPKLDFNNQKETVISPDIISSQTSAIRDPLFGMNFIAMKQKLSVKLNKESLNKKPNDSVNRRTSKNLIVSGELKENQLSNNKTYIRGKRVKKPTDSILQEIKAINILTPCDINCPVPDSQMLCDLNELVTPASIGNLKSNSEENLNMLDVEESNELIQLNKDISIDVFDIFRGYFVNKKGSTTRRRSQELDTEISHISHSSSNRILQSRQLSQKEVTDLLRQENEDAENHKKSKKNVSQSKEIPTTPKNQKEISIDDGKDLEKLSANIVTKSSQRSRQSDEGNHLKRNAKKEQVLTPTFVTENTDYVKSISQEKNSKLIVDENIQMNDEKVHTENIQKSPVEINSENVQEQDNTASTFVTEDIYNDYIKSISQEKKSKSNVDENIQKSPVEGNVEKVKKQANTESNFITDYIQIEDNEVDTQNIRNNQANVIDDKRSVMHYKLNPDDNKSFSIQKAEANQEIQEEFRIIDKKRSSQKNKKNSSIREEDDKSKRDSADKKEKKTLNDNDTDISSQIISGSNNFASKLKKRKESLKKQLSTEILSQNNLKSATEKSELINVENPETEKEVNNEVSNENPTDIDKANESSGLTTFESNLRKRRKRLRKKSSSEDSLPNDNSNKVVLDTRDIENVENQEKEDKNGNVNTIRNVKKQNTDKENTIEKVIGKSDTDLSSQVVTGISIFKAKLERRRKQFLKNDRSQKNDSENNLKDDVETNKTAPIEDNEMQNEDHQNCEECNIDKGGKYDIIDKENFTAPNDTDMSSKIISKANTFETKLRKRKEDLSKAPESIKDCSEDNLNNITEETNKLVGFDDKEVKNKDDKKFNDSKLSSQVSSETSLKFKSKKTRNKLDKKATEGSNLEIINKDSGDDAKNHGKKTNKNSEELPLEVKSIVSFSQETVILDENKINKLSSKRTLSKNSKGIKGNVKSKRMGKITKAKTSAILPKASLKSSNKKKPASEESTTSTFENESQEVKKRRSLRNTRSANEKIRRALSVSSSEVSNSQEEEDIQLIQEPKAKSQRTKSFTPESETTSNVFNNENIQNQDNKTVADVEEIHINITENNEESDVNKGEEKERDKENSKSIISQDLVCEFTDSPEENNTNTIKKSRGRKKKSLEIMEELEENIEENLKFKKEKKTDLKTVLSQMQLVNNIRLYSDYNKISYKPIDYQKSGISKNKINVDENTRKANVKTDNRNTLLKNESQFEKVLSEFNAEENARKKSTEMVNESNSQSNKQNVLDANTEVQISSSQKSKGDREIKKQLSQSDTKLFFNRSIRRRGYRFLYNPDDLSNLESCKEIETDDLTLSNKCIETIQDATNTDSDEEPPKHFQVIALVHENENQRNTERSKKDIRELTKKPKKTIRTRKRKSQVEINDLIQGIEPLETELVEEKLQISTREHEFNGTITTSQKSVKKITPKQTATRKNLKKIKEVKIQNDVTNNTTRANASEKEIFDEMITSFIQDINSSRAVNGNKRDYSTYVKKDDKRMKYAKKMKLSTASWLLEENKSKPISNPNVNILQNIVLAQASNQHENVQVNCDHEKENIYGNEVELCLTRLKQHLLSSIKEIDNILTIYL